MQLRLRICRRARLIWIIGFCIFTVSAADLAPPSAYEGKPIVAVRYEPPSQPVSRADLARLVPIEPGLPLHLDDVRFAIKRLYATGEYSNIEVGDAARSERRRAGHPHDRAVVRRSGRGARQSQDAAQRRAAAERLPARARGALR